MWINCAEVLLLRAYATLFAGGAPPATEKIDRLNEEYSLLKKLVENDPSQKNNLEVIHEETYKALDLTNRFRPIMSTDRSGSAKLGILQSNLKTFEETHDVIGMMSDALKNFGRPAFLRSPDAADEVRKATRLADGVVYAALTCSTIVAVLLFAVFVRGINAELAVMVENTERFKRGEKLNPPVKGTEELLQIDASFHRMVEDIRQAQSTKQAVIAMVSHDLRTPLGSVLGYFSLLTTGALKNASREALAGAQKQEHDIEQLMRLICDLLDLDKIEAEKLTIRLRTLPAVEIVDRAIDAVESYADWHEVSIQGADTNAKACADPDRIVQALANLLLSAITLTPGGSSVELTVHQQEDGLEMRVKSREASVSSDVLNKQFERYQPREAGLGLELPVSKAIIHLHHGKIGATSEQPQGCTLWLRLPAAQTN
jgi:signal transduction histidine kinase